MEQVKFEGVTIKLAGTDYTIPPLTFGQLKRLRARLKDLRMVDGNPDLNQLDIIQEVILSAMKRNYPDMTIEQLDDILDMGNVMTVFHGIMGQSGLVQAQGEKQAAAKN